ncbi:unnamed protein product [Dovyalis caffra]|uniref:Uncharacterized protein n=1 Tax=Dovyalis caffra TaxID=77055 RepID=A0AAV1SIE3_9ROSI|nr:unnamed protein product [Dovyalis caffra]
MKNTIVDQRVVNEPLALQSISANSASTQSIVAITKLHTPAIKEAQTLVDSSTLIAVGQATKFLASSPFSSKNKVQIRDDYLHSSKKLGEEGRVGQGEPIYGLFKAPQVGAPSVRV